MGGKYDRRPWAVNGLFEQPRAGPSISRLTTGQKKIATRFVLGGAAVVPLIVGLSLFELLDSGFRVWAERRPIVVAFGTSIIVIAFTSLVVDQIGRAREYRRTDELAVEAIEQLGSTALQQVENVAKAYRDAKSAIDPYAHTEPQAQSEAVSEKDRARESDRLAAAFDRLCKTAQAAQDAIAAAAARWGFLGFRDDLAEVLGCQRETAGSLAYAASILFSPDLAGLPLLGAVASALLPAADAVVRLADMARDARGTADGREIAAINRRLKRLTRGPAPGRRRQLVIDALEWKRDLTQYSSNVQNRAHDQSVETLNEFRKELDGDATEGLRVHDASRS